MSGLARQISKYADEVARLVASSSTTEQTYYPPIRALLAEALTEAGLPFEVRANTSEDEGMPDLAFYDGKGDFATVLGEVKPPSVKLEALAFSIDGNDQIGRYLERTRVVLLCNVRGFGLLTVDPEWKGSGPVPPSHRRLEETVELWTSQAEMASDATPATTFSTLSSATAANLAEELAELIETAVTRHAPISEPESLARILARLARRAKADLPENFTHAVQGLLDDFGEALGIKFTGEREDFFRSSLVQTAFYGVFAGWALWARGDRSEPFRWRDIASHLRIPFLGELFHQIDHPTRIKELGLARHLDHAAETLGRVDRARFLARFHVPSLRPGSDPESTFASNAILHFYEPFLKAYDPALRKDLGVWYTPGPIVRYQVRTVDRLLREELGCARGLASDDVVVLDPCCGTGAYLVEVLRCIAETLKAEGCDDAMLGARLLEATRSRIVGFEILTAPFVVAQLQLYLMLAELGAAPDAAHRPAIYLTNALTGWDGSEQLKLRFPELQEEHDAARKAKRSARIIAVVGNPPYNRFADAPTDEESALVDHYKGIARDAKGKQEGKSRLYAEWGVRKQLLNDLYVRFFRLAEKRIGERAEHGVVSFISNSSFWTGRSHPIMRESLLRRFHEIWCDSLNGDVRRGASVPAEFGAAADESAFVTGAGGGIMVGTGITTLLKRKAPETPPEKTPVHVRQFWGSAEAKHRSLLESLEMDSWKPARRKRANAAPEGPRPYETHLPAKQSRWKLVPIETSGGYEGWPGLDELFPVGYQGVNPNRGMEGGLVECRREPLERRMREYFGKATFAEFQKRHPVLCEPRARYDAGEMRAELRRVSGFREDRIVPYHVFPLDLRFLYYETEGKLLNERRADLWRALPGNSFLVATPQPRRISESRPLATSCLFDLHLQDRGSVGLPVLVPVANGSPDLVDHAAGNGHGRKTRANLAPAAWVVLAKAWTLKGGIGSESLQHDAPKRLVRDLFDAALAICHAPAYESEHADDLAQDWARIPIPRSRKVFERIAALGARVRALLDPLAKADADLDAILKGSRATLAVARSTDGLPIRESDFEIGYSYFASARGRVEARPFSSAEAAAAASILSPAEEPAARPATWGDDTLDVHLNDRVFLSNVPRGVWRHELGGYPVIRKWLGYRDKGRRPGVPLSLEELDHLRGIVHRLAALLALHEALDAAYAEAAADAWTVEELGLGPA